MVSPWVFWLVYVSPILNETRMLYTLLISQGAILNVKFMTSFAESNLSFCADFITLDPCLIARHQISSSKEESKKGQYLS